MWRRTTLFLTSLFGLACPGPSPTTNCNQRNVGDLVITEFLNDPAGADTGNEWIEIYNPTEEPIDLLGITLLTSKVDGTGAKTHIIRAMAPGSVIDAQGYYVVGDVRMGALPSYIQYSYKDDLGSMPSDQGMLALKCGAKTIDEVKYRMAPKSGHAVQLDKAVAPTAENNDDATKWCDATSAISETMNFGTPGKANSSCGGSGGIVGLCKPAGSNTPRSVRKPKAGDLFFSEIMPDPKAVLDTEGEWLELHSFADVDLNDLTLTVGTSKHTFDSAECLSIATDGDAVIAHSDNDATNGGVKNVLATFSAALPNAGGTVSISLSDGTLVDSATYGAAKSGASWQLNPAKFNATANDSADGFCEATMAYKAGGDLGTPGSENTSCGQVVATGKCRDAVTKTDRAVKAPTVGQLYFTEVMADPNAVADAMGEWLELRSDANVDLNDLLLTVNSTTRALTSADCISVATGDYVLLAKSADSATNGGLPKPAVVITQSLPNAGASLRLALPDGGVLDSMQYTTATSGTSTQLDPKSLSAAGNDNLSNFCGGTQAISSGGDLGTPGAANTTCGSIPTNDKCTDGATQRAIVKPTVGQLVITEVMANPSKVLDTAGEYVEVLANASFDLNGLLLSNEGSGMSTLTSTACIPVTTGSYFLIARSIDPMVNGGLPTPKATYDFDLANSAGTTARSVTIRSGATTLDTFSYTSATEGTSLQLKPGLTSPNDNDVAGNVCLTPNARYTLPDGGQGDKGTPGLANENCP